MKLLILCLLSVIAMPADQRRMVPKGYRDWKVYGGGEESIRYSTLDQINRSNVSKLEVAWTYDTGDMFPGSEMQCNPVIVDGLLYATSPKGRLFALDAASGKPRWSFDPNGNLKVFGKQRTRGVAMWSDGKEQRILYTHRHFLMALDARTGKLIPTFGDAGRVDLREGLGRPPEEQTISATSPGIIYKDLLILGSAAQETLPSPPGDIRAFDVRTGKIRWTFHTIPRPGEFGYDTWPKDAWKYTGSANSWPGMSIDRKRGLVFAGTGSPASDFYGANRTGDNLFANCLLALKADTGERVWHFQAVKHDLWDRDFPSPPSLVTVLRGGRMIDAVAQTTKSGHVLVFERTTGKSLFPIEYREVPPSDVEGEVTAKTQPYPLQPPPFARQELTEDMLTTRTPEAHKDALERFRKLRSKGQFVPPSREGTVVFPGFDGAAEWGGSAFDPATGMLYVNSNEMVFILRIIEKAKPKDGMVSGSALYKNNCASCHRDDRKGTPPEFPSLVGLTKKFTDREVSMIIRTGNGRMPGMPQLSSAANRAITRYVMFGEDTATATAGDAPSPFDTKYTTDGYNKFLDSEGYPAIKPPWGTLNAINLDTGTIDWKIPFGEFPKLAAKGLRNTGSENYGGPVVTAGGLLFIGATNHDRKFRAYDKKTGELLWETLLPAGGNATPATYEVNGRQFVVIGAGGGKSGAPSGGTYVAFALPEK